MGNIFSRFFGSLLSNSKKHHRILMIGLDAAGKTTILYKLRLNEHINTIPTIGFNVESVQYKNIEMQVWDVGGQDRIRMLWKHYYADADAIIFVVDAADSSRFQEAKETLEDVLSHPSLDPDAPMLIFANKQDLPGSNSSSQLARALDLTSIQRRDWFIQSCTAPKGDGLYEGLDWLGKALKANGSRRT